MRVGQGKDGIAVVFPQPPKHSSPQGRQWFGQGEPPKAPRPSVGSDPSRVL